MGNFHFGCKDSKHKKYNIRQEIVLPKLIPTSPEECFQSFFEKLKSLEFYLDFERTIFGY